MLIVPTGMDLLRQAGSIAYNPKYSKYAAWALLALDLHLCVAILLYVPCKRCLLVRD